jgi:hypothetical protein
MFAQAASRSVTSRPSSPNKACARSFASFVLAAVPCIVVGIAIPQSKINN